LSVKTIETHRENIKQKLQLRDAAELSRCAESWAADNLLPLEKRLKPPARGKTSPGET
jgi:hypothetical protein